MLQRRAAVLQQLDADVRVHPRELRNHQRQQLQPALHGDADAQPPVQLLLRLRDARAQVAVDVHHLMGRVYVLLPGIGQGDGVGRAVKDRRTQVLLDLLERLGERGLGDVELFARRGDGALAQDGEDVLHMLEIHRNPSPECCSITLTLWKI